MSVSVSLLRSVPRRPSMMRSVPRRPSMMSRMSHSCSTSLDLDLDLDLGHDLAYALDHAHDHVLARGLGLGLALALGHDRDHGRDGRGPCGACCRAHRCYHAASCDGCYPYHYPWVMPGCPSRSKQSKRPSGAEEEDEGCEQTKATKRLVAYSASLCCLLINLASVLCLKNAFVWLALE